MVLLRHITASSPAYAVHYHSVVYTSRYRLRTAPSTSVLISPTMSMPPWFQ